MARLEIKITPAAQEFIGKKGGSVQLVETRISRRG
jgi:hypothetical protein